MDYFTNINLNKNELQNAVLHPLATAPANPKAGQIYYNSGDKFLYFYNGTTWVKLNDIDLTDYAKKTDIGDATISIFKTSSGGTAIGSFTTNAKSAKSIYLALVKSDVGLGNVDNVKQYSASNPNFGTDNPLMDGSADVGKATTYARSDHKHPSDTSRAPVKHDSTAMTYGGGSVTNYGHVKLYQGDLSSLDTAPDSTAAGCAHTHSAYATVANPSFTGNVTIGGNLTVNGTTTTIESSTLAIKDKLIEVAKGNTTKLTSPAGLVVPKYDGTNSGALVFDGDGIAYVGDVTLNSSGDIDVTKSDLVPLAARAKSISNGNVVKWDSAKQLFTDAGFAATDIARKSQANTFTQNQTIQTALGTTALRGSYIAVKQGDNQVELKPSGVTVGTLDTSGSEYAHKADLQFPQKSGTIALTSDIKPFPSNMAKKFSKDFSGNGTATQQTWAHGLGTDAATVSLYKKDSDGGYEMVMADIVLNSVNVIIRFAVAPAADDTFRVVVTG